MTNFFISTLPTEGLECFKVVGLLKEGDEFEYQLLFGLEVGNNTFTNFLDLMSYLMLIV